MPIAAARRLPGVSFEPRAAPLDQALPRMDIAVFVGFASRGPIDLPVPVESVPQFESVFGPDAPLAWDAERGEMTHALLAPAVRGFFRNGGRRCWIVRVAGTDASAGRFALPGLMAVRFAENGTPSLAPAFALARSRGSWSDDLRVSTALRQRPLRPALPYDGGRELFVWTGAGLSPSSGDTVRIASGSEEVLVFAGVETVAAMAGSPPGAGMLRLTLGPAVAFVRVAPHSPPISTARAWVFASEQVGSPPMPSASPPVPEPGRAVDARIALSPDLEVVLDLSPAQSPPPGTLVRIDAGAQRWWLVVERLGVEPRGFGLAAQAVRVAGPIWRESPGPAPTIGAGMRIDLLSFDLRVHDGNLATYTLRDLGLAPLHPRYWNALERDESHFAESRTAERPTGLARQFELAGPAAAQDAARFPLAGGEPGAPLFIPLGIPGTFGAAIGPLQTARTRLERDGLSRFGHELFLDPALASVGVDTFMTHADHIRYLSPNARALRGIHAALGWREATIIEEATLIAAPDAVHRSWEPIEPAAPAPASADFRVTQPDWWRFLPCERTAEGKEQELPLSERLEPSGFIAADVREIVRPQWLGDDPTPDRSGTFRLSWALPEPDADSVLEEASRPDFADAHELYRGAQSEFTLYGRSPGTYYYRVRAFVGRNGSHWSAARIVSIGQIAEARLVAPAAFDETALLAVHRALMRMCGARADMLAVLSLPLHFREDDAIAYAQALTAGTGQTSAVPPLSPAEARVPSYAALYHPWIATRRADGKVTLAGPDGAASGVLAARAIARGAWIAPANESLREALALSPPMAPERLAALQAAQINVMRREPRGFLCLNADTLSADPDLRQIGVRRLLILLRRLALRRGATYVFEPLSGAFRRLVQRGFETVLHDMFQRGAFAGRTPAESYQVNTGTPPNTAQGLDAGRFVVELKVAPALPMRFLSIRLLQAGERLTATEAS